MKKQVTFQASIKALATGTHTEQDGGVELVLKITLEGSPDDAPDALKALAEYQERGAVEVTVAPVQGVLPGV